MSGGQFVGYYEGFARDYIYSDDDFGVCYCDDEDCEECYLKEKKMSKDYMTSTGYAYDTEADAIDAAKKRAFKNAEDVKIYRAYKIAKTTTPNVEVTDLVLA